jgi:membrane peptidoglycan carboxypeptidase
MLTGVVERGTGKEARITGMCIAGKTGTAQIFDSAYSKKHYNASFAGYLPTGNPQIAMMIILDKPKGNIYGGATAAPIFRNIARSWIAVTDNIEEYVNDDNSLADSTFIMPDLGGFDYFNARKILLELGIKCEKRNHNFVIASQTPKLGTLIEEANKIVVKFTSVRKKKRK